MKAFIFFVGITAILLKLDLSSVRQEYKEAVLAKTKTIALYKKLQGVTKKDNKVLVAYKGAITTLFGKQQKKIKDKEKHFKQGVSLVEYAIKKDPSNIEIHFIRLTIQQNIPKFLNYYKNRKEDKKFVLNNLKNVKSKALKEYIVAYIMQSKNFTEEEKKIVSQ